jgi:hypothetical protein
MRTTIFQSLVPSARLELAQLSPLPPQDSVSTNFTTTAVVASTCKALQFYRKCATFVQRNAPKSAGFF